MKISHSKFLCCQKTHLHPLGIKCKNNRLTFKIYYSTIFGSPLTLVSQDEVDKILLKITNISREKNIKIRLYNKSIDVLPSRHTKNKRWAPRKASVTLTREK